jgi:hypothetical protein
VVVACFYVPSRNLPGEADNYENLPSGRSGQLVWGPRFENWTSRIRSRSVIYPNRCSVRYSKSIGLFYWSYMKMFKTACRHDYFNHWCWHGSFFPSDAKSPPPHPRHGKIICSSMLMWEIVFFINVVHGFYHAKFFCLWILRHKIHSFLQGARGSVVGWGTMLQAGRSRFRVPVRWIFFNLPYPSSRIMMALGSTQPLTEMSIRNLPGGSKGRQARKADNLTAICEPTI